MYSLLIVLIIIFSILLMMVILLQSSKGGGLAGSLAEDKSEQCLESSCIRYFNKINNNFSNANFCFDFGNQLFFFREKVKLRKRV